MCTSAYDVASFTEQDYTVMLGMVDLPEVQKQEEYVIDFVKNGHFAYIASSGYGKSVLLGTIIASLAVKNNVNYLNFYI